MLKPGHVLGYLQVTLYKNRSSQQFKMHRLVARAFIPNPENKPQINHKNGIKTDNRLENLEWCTAKENIQHGYNIGLISHKGERHNRAKITLEQAKEIYKLAWEGKLFQREIAKLYNISETCIYHIKYKKRWNYF